MIEQVAFPVAASGGMSGNALLILAIFLLLAVVFLSTRNKQYFKH
jgi:hypothetical protein